MKIKLASLFGLFVFSSVCLFGQSKKEVIQSLNYSFDSLKVIIQYERSNFENYKLQTQQKIKDLEEKNQIANQQLIDKSNQLNKKEKEFLDFVKIHKDCEKSNLIDAFENVKTFDVLSGTYNPENAFWVGNAMEEEVFPDGYFKQFDQLNIIPDPFLDESNPNMFEIHDEMTGIVETNFALNPPYNLFSGAVKVYYDKAKKILASKYNVKNGLPIGTVKFYSPKGDLIVERVFNKEGSFVRSILEPFSTNWKFDFNNSNLILYDFKNAVKDESSLTTLNLMSSVYQDSADVYRNYIYSIIDKSVYSKAFKVNGQKFTGVLKGYYFKKSTGAIGYEVSIKNGYLEGDVITFNESGDTSLYEIFSHGKLIKTLIEGEDGVAKPIIYLYPKEDTDIKVSLKFDGELSHTYPSYNNGWFVHAKPSGQLYDKDSLEYYALYWEGKNNEEFVINDGIVVAGNESAKFLNDVLKQLGLNRREANEFIVYWLPKLESSPYNLIHFAFEDYESMAKLIVEPKPDETIRVMMVFQPLNQKVLFKEQKLPNKVISRNGFTVVEWGGTEIKSRYITSNGIK